MDLDGILAIGGKPGLYKMVAQSRTGLIVESLTDNKRFPVSQTGNVSALKDIAIYTYGEEVPLPEVYGKVAEKENGGKTVNPKEISAKEMEAYMEELLPDYDRERVYTSDLKKLFNWYNLLHEAGLITLGEETEVADKEDTAESAEAIASEKEEKVTAPKKDTEAKAYEKK
jgi:hypothetical protein